MGKSADPFECALPEYRAFLWTFLCFSLGYFGVHMKRVEDHYHEGEATFFKEEKFTLLEYKGIALRDLAFKVRT